MDPLSKRVAARFLVADAEPGVITNLPRLERIVTSIEAEAEQMRHSFDKYKSDPMKYKPQLANVEHSAFIISSDIRTLVRTLGREASSKTAKYGDSVGEDIRKAMDLLTYLPNGVAAFHAAHGGNAQKAKINAEKIRKAEELLGEVLADLPGAYEYVFFGEQTVKSKDREEFIKAMGRLGYKYTGDSTRRGVRPELQGQPEFQGLAMTFGGAGVVRYDTWENFDRLSR